MVRTLDVKYTQNFLQNITALQSILKKYIKINSADTVVEIGAGTGNLTWELAKVAKNVIAYEIDPVLFQNLKNEIASREITNIELRDIDFLKTNLGKLDKFKIFANIPFFLTSEIIRKILLTRNKLSHAYLFMEKDAAFRFIGKPYRKDSLVSIIIELNWEIKIIYNFLKTDFRPVPNASVVLISLKRKTENAEIDNFEFQDFVSFLYVRKKANIKQTLLTLFTFPQVKQIKKHLKLKWEQSSSDLTFDDWLYLYKLAKGHIDKDKLSIIFGCFANINNIGKEMKKGRGLIVLQKNRGF